MTNKIQGERQSLTVGFTFSRSLTVSAPIKKSDVSSEGKTVKFMAVFPEDFIFPPQPSGSKEYVLGSNISA